MVSGAINGFFFPLSRSGGPLGVDAVWTGCWSKAQSLIVSCNYRVVGGKLKACMGAHLMGLDP